MGGTQPTQRRVGHRPTSRVAYSQGGNTNQCTHHLSITKTLHRERRQVSLEPTLVHLAVGRLYQVRTLTPADAAHAVAVLLPPLDGCHGVRIERARPLRERQAREQPPQRAQRTQGGCMEATVTDPNSGNETNVVECEFEFVNVQPQWNYNSTGFAYISDNFWRLSQFSAFPRKFGFSRPEDDTLSSFAYALNMFVCASTVSTEASRGHVRCIP